MIDTLNSILKNDLSALLLKPEAWDSLVINRRKPYTYRVFTTLPNGLRLCLHKFEVCDTHEAFAHPHPWPAAFMILSGQYKLKLGRSLDRKDSNPVDVATMIMSQYSSYEMLDPLTWHSVIPLTTTYTVMINGTPWSQEFAHQDVRTTKGKDLQKMSEDELKKHLNMFREFLQNFTSVSQADIPVVTKTETSFSENMKEILDQSNIREHLKSSSSREVAVDDEFLNLF